MTRIGNWIACMVIAACGPSAWAEDTPTETLRWEVVVDAPVERVWDAWTTKEGIESWLVPHAEVDLRVGGAIRTNYNRDGKIGDDGTIVTHIMAFEPRRALITRFTAPPTAPQAKIAENTWGVMQLESITPSRTRIVLTSYGWKRGGEWDTARAFFEKGNAWTLEQLRLKLSTPGAADQDAKAMELLRSLVGGEWIHEKVNDNGTAFRVRNVMRFAPDGKSIVADGWLGGADGMFYHGATQIWREPSDGTVRFQSVSETGALARGAIILDGADTLVWDWKQTSTDGKVKLYEVRMKVRSANEYQFTLYEPDSAGGKRQLVLADFQRVDSAPARFTTLKPAGPAGAGKASAAPSASTK